MRAPVPAALPADVTLDRSQSGIMPSTVAYMTSMCAPNAPASRMRSSCLDAEPLHQQANAGHQRRLGELDRAHVVLRDAERLGAFVQHVGVGTPTGHDPR